MFNSVGYTELILMSSITAVALYLWRSSRSKEQSTMVDLKKLKVLPSNIEESSAKSESSGEKSLIEKMKASGKSLVIFFGSQTGTAEEFAQRLSKNARLYGLKALVVDPEETDMVCHSTLSLSLSHPKYYYSSFELLSLFL